MVFIVVVIVLALWLSLPTAHAGEFLGEWKITRYYTPVLGQSHYLNGWKGGNKACATANMYWNGYNGKRGGDYSADLCMQSSGDPFITADGTDLRHVQPLTTAACPKTYLGRTLHIAQIGYVFCNDTGGSIKGKRIDLWTGIGDEGIERMQLSPGGVLSVHLKAL